MKRSKRIEDEVFGVLKLDSEINCYESKVEFAPGKQVRVSINVVDENDDIEPAVAIERARQIYRKTKARERSIRRSTADNILDNYNDNWNEGEPITATGFMRHMKLQSISIKPNSVELDYDVGDLFYGHTVYVVLDDQLNFDHASLYG